MTRLHAERITGLAVERVVSPPGTVTWEARDEGGRLVCLVVERLTRRGESKALDQLILAVYRKRSDQVRREQHFRCFCCNRIAPLEIDHIISRGTTHGRDDRRRNLRALASRCHKLRTDDKSWDKPPHPEIAALMSNVGLAWGGQKVGWLEQETKHVEGHNR